jgi:hypothetical protein
MEERMNAITACTALGLALVMSAASGCGSDDSGGGGSGGAAAGASGSGQGGGSPTAGSAGAIATGGASPGGARTGGSSTGGAAGTVATGGAEVGGVAGEIATGGALATGGSAPGGSAGVIATSGAGGELPVGGAGGRAGSAGAAGTAACTPAGVEDCFNGLDDDCNGYVDCADSACTPVGECVDVTSGDPVGTYDPAATVCGAGYSGVDLHQGMDAPATCEGCSYTPFFTRCTMQLGSRSGCGGQVVASQGVMQDQCTDVLGFDPVDAYVGTPTMSPVCSVSGSPVPSPATWAADATFCQADAGGGCGVGRACVPRLQTGERRCRLVAGAASCASLVDEGQWYTAVADARTCAATCPASTPTDGNCGTGTVVLYQNRYCAGTTTEIPEGDTCGVPGTHQSASIQLDGYVAPTCPLPDLPASGSATPTGLHTLCCSP